MGLTVFLDNWLPLRLPFDHQRSFPSSFYESLAGLERRTASEQGVSVPCIAMMVHVQLVARLTSVARIAGYNKTNKTKNQKNQKNQRKTKHKKPKKKPNQKKISAGEDSHLHVVPAGNLQINLESKEESQLGGIRDGGKYRHLR